jgi:hypothetical protein
MRKGEEELQVSNDRCLLPNLIRVVRAFRGLAGDLFVNDFS